MRAMTARLLAALVYQIGQVVHGSPRLACQCPAIGSAALKEDHLD